MSADEPERHVLVVRHGETEWSSTGRHTGRTDLPLTEAGRHEAERLAGRLRSARFDRVLTSPSTRAMETCRITGFGDIAERHDALQEWDYGAYEGLTTKEIHSHEPEWDLWHHGAPGGESPSDVSRRVDRLLDHLIHTCTSGYDVLVFGHGHLSRALAVRWVGLAVECGRLLGLGTASVSTLGWKRDHRVIEVWNDRAHL